MKLISNQDYVKIKLAYLLDSVGIFLRWGELLLNSLKSFLGVRHFLLFFYNRSNQVVKKRNYIQEKRLSSIYIFSANLIHCIYLGRKLTKL